LECVKTVNKTVDGGAAKKNSRGRLRGKTQGLTPIVTHLRKIKGTVRGKKEKVREPKGVILGNCGRQKKGANWGLGLGENDTQKWGGKRGGGGLKKRKITDLLQKILGSILKQDQKKSNKQEGKKNKKKWEKNFEMD